MRTFRTILLVFVLTQVSESCQLSSGCEREDDLKELTEEVKKWTPYTQESKLIFQSDFSKDTILVAQYQEDVESYFRGDECPFGAMETLSVKLHSKLFSDTIFFKLESQDKVSLKSNGFLIEYRDTEKYLAAIDNSKSYHSTLTIKQRTFTEAIVSKCVTCDSLNEIVFAKNVGVVAYKIENVYWVRK